MAIAMNALPPSRFRRLCFATRKNASCRVMGAVGRGFKPRTPMALTKSQRDAIAAATRLRAISRRCAEFSKFVGYRSVSDRLDALAAKYQKQARSVEERAGLCSNRRDPDDWLSFRSQERHRHHPG